MMPYWHQTEDALLGEYDSHLAASAPSMWANVDMKVCHVREEHMKGYEEDGKNKTFQGRRGN